MLALKNEESLRKSILLEPESGVKKSIRQHATIEEEIKKNAGENE